MGQATGNAAARPPVQSECSCYSFIGPYILGLGAAPPLAPVGLRRDKFDIQGKFAGAQVVYCGSFYLNQIWGL